MVRQFVEALGNDPFVLDLVIEERVGSILCHSGSTDSATAT